MIDRYINRYSQIDREIYIFKEIDLLINRLTNRYYKQI